MYFSVSPFFTRMVPERVAFPVALTRGSSHVVGIIEPIVQEDGGRALGAVRVVARWAARVVLASVLRSPPVHFVRPMLVRVVAADARLGWSTSESYSRPRRLSGVLLPCDVPP